MRPYASTSHPSPSFHRQHSQTTHTQAAATNALSSSSQSHTNGPPSSNSHAQGLNAVNTFSGSNIHRHSSRYANGHSHGAHGGDNHISSADKVASASTALDRVMNLMDGFEDDFECPLCLEDMDPSDLNFRPCPCGYQICQFCYHHIKENLNNRCPACRALYDDKTVEFKVMKAEDLKRLQQAKKIRDKRRKDEALSMKDKATVRVRQRAQVHIQGMTTKTANEDTVALLKGSDHFGQYGKVVKLFMATQSAGTAQLASKHSHFQPVNVYINYRFPAEASACIAATDGSTTVDGQTLKANWGTTRYCSAYLKGAKCTNDSCMQAHEPGEELEGVNGSASREESTMHVVSDVDMQRARNGGSNGAARNKQDGIPLPPTASWAAKTPTMTKSTPAPLAGDTMFGGSSAARSAATLQAIPVSKPTTHPLPARPSTRSARPENFSAENTTDDIAADVGTGQDSEQSPSPAENVTDALSESPFLENLAPSATSTTQTSYSPLVNHLGDFDQTPSSSLNDDLPNFPDLKFGDGGFSFSLNLMNLNVKGKGRESPTPLVDPSVQALGNPFSIHLGAPGMFDSRSSLLSGITPAYLGSFDPFSEGWSSEADGVERNNNSPSPPLSGGAEMSRRSSKFGFARGAPAVKGTDLSLASSRSMFPIGRESPIEINGNHTSFAPPGIGLTIHQQPLSSGYNPLPPPGEGTRNSDTLSLWPGANLSSSHSSNGTLPPGIIHSLVSPLESATSSPQLSPRSRASFSPYSGTPPAGIPLGTPSNSGPPGLPPGISLSRAPIPSASFPLPPPSQRDSGQVGTAVAKEDLLAMIAKAQATSAPRKVPQLDHGHGQDSYASSYFSDPAILDARLANGANSLALADATHSLGGGGAAFHPSDPPSFRPSSPSQSQRQLPNFGLSHGLQLSDQQGQQQLPQYSYGLSGVGIRPSMQQQYPPQAALAFLLLRLYPLHGVKACTGSVAQKFKLDLNSFTKPARIQILLVPVHPIKRSKFERYADLIRGFSRIQLSDVPPDARGERAIFSASPVTPGALLFEFLTPTTYASSHPLAFLSEFQIHRRIHGIIGILDSTEYEPGALASRGLQVFQKSLRDLPKTFATKVYAFEPTDGQLEEGRLSKEAEGPVMIPQTGDIAFYLSTLLADFASQVLWDFSNLAAQLESRTSLPTPQETPGFTSPFSYIPHKATAKGSISTYTSPSSNKKEKGHKVSNSSVSSQSAITSSQPAVNLGSLGIAPPPQSRTALGLWGGSTSGNQDGFMYGNVSIQTNMALLPGAAPSPPPGGALVDRAARKKVLGREKKLMADIWLLAGRLNEAIAAYNEAILLLKGWQDQVWQASAIEGLVVALIVHAWSPKPARFNTQLQANNSGTKSPPPNDTVAPVVDPSTFLSLIPERMGQAVALYAKMLAPLPNSDGSSGPPDPDRSHPLVYAEACLRCARFLLSVWECGGWIGQALEKLVLPSPRVRSSPKTNAEQARAARLASLSPSNTVPRSMIALWISSAYTPLLATLDTPIRLRVTGEIATLFGRIGYRRKEGHVLRELSALCAEAVAGKSIEVVSESLPTNPDDWIKGDPKLKVHTASGHGPSSIRTTSDSTGNKSIVRLAEKVCETFGVIVAPEAEAYTDRKGLLQGRVTDSLETGHDKFGWPALQVAVLKDAISIVEALPDYQAAIRFTVSALRSLSSAMLPIEQYQLSQNIPRVFAAATRRGAAFELDYWGPTHLLMSMEIARLSQNRSPVEHSYQDVQSNAKATVAALQKDPFIYNPSKGPAAVKVRPTIVQNELTEVYVTLGNPYLFDLEIPSIELSTSGVQFTSDPMYAIVPPGSFSTVRLTGTPKETGTLVIRGCNIRLAGCRVKEFLLPVRNDEHETHARKMFMLTSSHDRVKRTGLAAFTGRHDVPSNEKGLKFMECLVVPEMPLLFIRSTSLTHGALMLYEGEKSTIRIGLENAATSPIDFVKLTFSDMLTTTTQTYLSENELSPADAYDIESDNHGRAVFSWSSESPVLIQPGASTFLEIQCLGKVGCGSGTIQIDYAFVDRPVVHSSGAFYTRQLFCDIFMTVHSALVASLLDVYRLKALPEYEAGSHTRSASVVNLGTRGAALDQLLEASFRDVDDGTHCLVAVDVMNVYGKPFDVKLERCEDHGEFFQLKQRLEPGATARMLVRLERIHLSVGKASLPIPMLSERQFVVSKVKQTAVDEQTTRELFWYREELLRRIKLTWNEVGSLRTGTINLRPLKLNKSVLDVLCTDRVDIELALSDNPSSPPGCFQLSGMGRRLTYTAMSNEFLDVLATVSNNTDKALRLSVRLDLRPPESSGTSRAALSHLSRYVMVDGVSPTPLPILLPSESRTVTISICVLAEGSYEIGCIVEETRNSLLLSAYDLRGETVLNGIQSEQAPKVYRAREPLLLEVQD